MVYFILILILAFVVMLFTMAGGEGQNYSKKNQYDPDSDDHFNSFTL
jgi:hypothetical protein